MSGEKQSYLVTHRRREHNGKILSVIIELSQAKYDSLEDAEFKPRKRAEDFVAMRFNTMVREIHGLKSTATYAHLLPPEPVDTPT